MECQRMSSILVLLCAFRAKSATCPGTFNMAGYGSVSLVPTGWNTPSGGAEVKVLNNGHVRCNMGGRAYFADTCTAGNYDHKQYLAHNLLGKTMRYTTDMSEAGCGCNAAFYLTSLHQNTENSTCNDYYCDANKVCGVWCAEIDIQEANKFAWHSTLHTAHDRSGVGAGYGGGGKGWNGPREWTSLEYGPGEKCIDSSKSFDVAASFPVDAEGMLIGMEITLSQEGRSCPLSVSIDKYDGMAKLTKALKAGMTPILSYWKANDMLWMDGKGEDGKGPCAVDHKNECPDSIQFYNFSIHKYVNTTAVSNGQEEFCCLATSDSSDFCGKCFPAAKAGKNSHCGKDKSSCHACGGKATWCSKSKAKTAGNRDGFCCLAASNSRDFCSTCFSGAKAKPSSKCGGSKASCHACGGKATWCTDDSETDAKATDNEEGFCCLAAPNHKDFCGTCFSGAKAKPGSKCGGSKTSCQACGSHAVWCKAGMTNTSSATNSLTKNGHVLIHVESSEISDKLAEGMEARIAMGDAPPLHVKVVKMA